MAGLFRRRLHFKARTSGLKAAMAGLRAAVGVFKLHVGLALNQPSNNESCKVDKQSAIHPTTLIYTIKNNLGRFAAADYHADKA